MCEQKNLSRLVNAILRILRNAMLLTLDTGVGFAALPRVRTGLAELRPPPPNFSHNPKKPVRDRTSRAAKRVAVHMTRTCQASGGEILRLSGATRAGQGRSTWEPL
jgi:hypothetical protein